MHLSPHSPPQVPERFLERMLAWTRWATIAALLLITMAQPSMSSIGWPSWMLLGLFIGYCLLIEGLRRRIAWLRSLAHRALLDAPVAALLYALGAEPGGPLFVLLLLAVDAAAASLALRGTLLYTAGVALLATAIDVALPLWTSTPFA